MVMMIILMALHAVITGAITWGMFTPYEPFFSVAVEEKSKSGIVRCVIAFWTIFTIVGFGVITALEMVGLGITFS